MKNKNQIWQELNVVFMKYIEKKPRTLLSALVGIIMLQFDPFLTTKCTKWEKKEKKDDQLLIQLLKKY